MTKVKVILTPSQAAEFNAAQGTEKRLWDNYRIVGEIQKSDRIKIQVAAAVRDGVRYLNVREFYFRQKDGEWRASRDGITIPLLVPIKHGEELIKPYDALIELLALAADTVVDMELSDPDYAVYVIKEAK